ncbi:capsular polysaccharide export protein, LipB/KpsS family [Leisingera aquaemixtae]|uniref:Capsule polysaccharide biosynthesis protein n=1 Tax=Leisingera aquaemixtae TaxID=1396826 RepID=A0A0P1HET2_9RHOB|nr:hypothetical protein [Leisingera aquaemixtae]CUI02054.1 Capsule polysaccharide biosynthesis protein [Leisingera aquaemixtae]
MPKVIIHLRKKHIESDLSRGFLQLFGVIQKMLAAEGIGCDIRALDAGITSRMRQVPGDCFADGNLHILDDRSVQMPNVLNAALAYLDGFWHLDPEGTRGFSSIAARDFREDMIPYQYAKQFFGRLQRTWKDARRTRYSAPREREDIPQGCISVFFQGSYPVRTGATEFTDIAMLQDVLQGAGHRTVLVKPHPLLASIATMAELAEIAAGDRRVVISGANIHDILAASCVTVSINSTAAMEGFLHRTPAILYGTSDFHHMAETITGPGQFAGALQRALARKGGYAQFLTWYFRKNCLEIGAPDVEQRIWEIFGRAGFPRARFTAERPPDRLAGR